MSTSSNRVVLLIPLLLAACMSPMVSPRDEAPPTEDPREELSANPPVEVTVERVGLGGVVPTNSQATVLVRLENKGPAAKLDLEMVAWPKFGDHYYDTTLADIRSHEVVELGRNETVRVSWIISTGNTISSAHGDADLLVVARDESGRVVGVGPAPSYRMSNRAVLVLASDKETGLRVKEAVDRVEVNRRGFVGDRDVAVMIDDPPLHWYEYSPLGGLILARPWSKLPEPAQRAIRNYVAFGGTLLVLSDECPDVSAGEMAVGAPGSAPSPFGLGRIAVSPSFTEDQNDSEEDWFSRILPLDVFYGAPLENLRPNLTISYLMPSPTLVVAVLLAIVLLMGPITHLVLIRLGRREWAWLLLPALGVILAGGMYLVASGVQGEDSEVETHHMIANIPGTGQALAVTSVRVLRADAEALDLRMAGDQPRLFDQWYISSLADTIPSEVRLDDEAIEEEGINMHRFSRADFRFASLVAPVQVELEQLGPNAVRVTNTSGSTLRDLRFRRDGRWAKLDGDLAPGQARTWRDVELEIADPYIYDVSRERDEALQAEQEMLYAAASLVPDSKKEKERVTLVAGCELEKLPSTTITPAPVTEATRTTCVWSFPLERDPDPLLDTERGTP